MVHLTQTRGILAKHQYIDESDLRKFRFDGDLKMVIKTIYLMAPSFDKTPTKRSFKSKYNSHMTCAFDKSYEPLLTLLVSIPSILRLLIRNGGIKKLKENDTHRATKTYNLIFITPCTFDKHKILKIA